MSLLTSIDGLLPGTPISEACKTLRTIASHLTTQPQSASFILERVFHPKASAFLKRLEKDALNEEFLLCALKCIDDTLGIQSENQLTANQTEAYVAIGDSLLHLLYQLELSSKNSTLIALTTLSILNKILTKCSNYTQLHISELLGIARLLVHFGLPHGNVKIYAKPQKVQPSQQLPSESSADELETSLDNSDTQKARCAAGGKVSKKRKPRSIVKSKQNANQQQQQQNWRTFDLENIIADIKTSDSDASEIETGVVNAQRTFSLQERQNFAKVRQAAINLLGIIATNVQDRRFLYAYWHGFFENIKIPSSSNNNRSDLLFIALHDPNSRCRSLALQVAAQLIFNSKNFLQQAECVEQHCPTTFTPFAHNLGFQVLSLFEELTMVISTESSLTVLTQALKCLAVLVQAITPFKRFQPREFILTFVNEVRRLTCHRDPTIQVSALMVMEFLIATPEHTPEISLALGASYKTQVLYDKHLNDQDPTNLMELDKNLEEFIESESEEDIYADKNPMPEMGNTCTKASIEMTWLLQRVLQYLNAFPATSELNLSTSLSVRIECLQILAAMFQHFNLLRSHLDLVANCIENAIKDTNIELRICGARCLDTIAHQISILLLENDTNLMDECLRFWTRLLPIIMNHMSSSSTVALPASLKVCLCDALSNIGVIIFERQTFALQMNLIGFLSGIANDSNEEVIVRIAAVRALAVYILFPSLRDNLVFIENTAESALRLVVDTNLLVRVKAHWALGNISDALLIQINNSKERISNDILWRMIVAATDACSDNDKVRCNAVRTLGNLLRLLNLNHFNLSTSSNMQVTDNHLRFQNAITKLIDCLRTAGSAKVKWNTCYAIGNLVQNSALFYKSNESNEKIAFIDFDWQSKLFPILANVIVQHPNFKVRINATAALMHIEKRSHFGIYFELFCKALLDAMEQSHHLDNFYEYNHRDQLQEQLCLAICHLLRLSLADDFLIIYKYLDLRIEVVRNICCRVVNRMVPERSAPILACTAYLLQQLKTNNSNYTSEQINAINSILNAFNSEGKY